MILIFFTNFVNSLVLSSKAIFHNNKNLNMTKKS